MRAVTLFLIFISLYLCSSSAVKDMKPLLKNQVEEVRNDGQRKNLMVLDMNVPSMSISLISSNTPAPKVLVTPASDNFFVFSPTSNGIVFPDMNAPFMSISLLNTDKPTATITENSEPTKTPTIEPTIKLQKFSPNLQPTKSPASAVIPTDAPTSSSTLSPLTKTPTLSPEKKLTDAPTISLTTLLPTKSPTDPPTNVSTKYPSFPLTEGPTFTPTKKTASPTKQPFFSTNYDHPKYWFDYDSSSDYGPYNWNDISNLDQNSIYLDYLQDDSNECDNDKQSPIDLRSNDQCGDDHTPAQAKGESKFKELEFSIESSGLRVVLEGNDDDKNAKLDFSNLSDFIPAVFVNAKVPSEHHLFGKSYAGEFQIYHHWDKGNGRFVVVSVLMDDSEDKEHLQLEQFLREWEETAWRKKRECDRLSNPDVPPYSRTYERLGAEEMVEIWGVRPSGDRSDYDIHRFMTTGWYCAYDGSITEPPCSSRVHWRVLDVPMKVSKMQIQRMRNLIQGRLNDNCQRETAAFNGRVNRPLQKSKEDVWCCTSSDWKFNINKDPSYWFESWPADYHGWDNVENFKPQSP